MFSSPFESYAYSYPHKAAYRPLDPNVSLHDAWSSQQRDALFLYVHVPFCEYRCGFCNLFTLARPDGELPALYLKSLRKQATQFAECELDHKFVRFALGGGTPTFLSIDELRSLMSIITDVLGADLAAIPGGCEASPSTIDSEKLHYLRSVGVDRLSLGVQSFEDKDVHAIGRPQRAEDVHQAIVAIREAGFPTLNLDLIYGGAGQTLPSWLRSVETAIDYRAEEIYLYPLYVRQLTGLGRRVVGSEMAAPDRALWDEQRLAFYREARDLLVVRGYEQTSLRMFRLRDANSISAPTYRCQEDGMLGLGCGARSYTSDLHYSYEYAVTTSAIRDVITRYLQLDADAFSRVDYGFRLDREDQQRRYAILSLLQCEGLSRADYRSVFDSDVLEDLPSILRLEQAGYLNVDVDRLKLTPNGLEYSDAIGPWLRSEKVGRLEATYQWR